MTQCVDILGESEFVIVNGKRVVISGAAGGIGEVASELFCRNGSSVIGVDVNDEAGARLQDRLKAKGLSFEYRSVDISDSSSVRVLADHVRGSWGELDVLFNNAGVVLGKHLSDTTLEEWERVQSITLRGTFLMTRELAPLMQASGKGSIVNVASTAALVGYGNMTAYGAAKGGVLLLTKATAMDLAPAIRANVICPGTIDTPMPRVYADVATPEGQAVWDGYSEGHMLGRVGRPEEVAQVAMFLASDASSFMTGASVPVDGGWSAR